MNNLAIVLQERGKWQKAEEMHTKVLEARRRVLGQDHQDTLSSMNNLANVLQKQGKWQKAEEMHTEVLEARRRVLGQDHQDTLSSTSNLATVLQEQGKWQKAEEMHTEVLEGMRPSSWTGPPGHPEQHEQPGDCPSRARQVAES